MSELHGFSTPGAAEKDITIPRFYMRPVKNEFRTKLEGRPIFDDVEYVEIVIPGQKSTVDERVKDEHRQRWPDRYRAFKDNQEAPEHGTPLSEWPGVTRGQVEELSYFHIRTVETLAALDDAALSRAIPMGGFAIRDKARRYLDAAKGAAPADALAAENEQLRETISAMKEQIDQMAEEIQKLREAGAKGEGR